MARPNFFIVGAPKSGTTALYTYLRSHPDVFMPSLKEPSYFGSDLTGPWFMNSMEDYLALFLASRGEKCIGEASTTYLYSERAAEEIHEFCPAARILIMLRHPVDMIYALHSERLYEGQEDIADFAQALSREDARSCGEELPKGLHLPRQCVLYRRIGRYARQVERYIRIFGRSQVKVFLFDELKRDPRRIFEEACRFLQISPHGKSRFQVVNANKTIRSRRLMRLLRDQPDYVWKLKTLIPRPLRRFLFGMLMRGNTATRPRLEMSQALRDQLTHGYSADIARLASILGRDLKEWREPRVGIASPLDY